MNLFLIFQHKLHQLIQLAWPQPSWELRSLVKLPERRQLSHIGAGTLAPVARSARLDAERAQPAPAARPLRVVRVIESGDRQSSLGRIVISGRMADVCAELDRLAAREAALR
jgi:hypothetical protein